MCKLGLAIGVILVSLFVAACGGTSLLTSTPTATVSPLGTNQRIEELERKVGTLEALQPTPTSEAEVLAKIAGAELKDVQTSVDAWKTELRLQAIQPITVPTASMAGLYPGWSRVAVTQWTYTVNTRGEVTQHYRVSEAERQALAQQQPKAPVWRSAHQTATGGLSDHYVEGIGQQQVILPTRNHVDAKTVNYNTTPPTSGDHWSRPAACGFYEAGLPDEQVVHNLEHGAIVVSYNLASPDEVDQLRKAVEGIGILNQIWGVTRFYDKIDSGTVAAAAWGVLDTMQGVDGDRTRKFFNTYAGKLGPEKSSTGIGIPC